MSTTTDKTMQSLVAESVQEFANPGSVVSAIKMRAPLQRNLRTLSR